VTQADIPTDAKADEVTQKVGVKTIDTVPEILPSTAVTAAPPVRPS
jgi:hypothetical protein